MDILGDCDGQNTLKLYLNQLYNEMSDFHIALIIHVKFKWNHLLWSIPGNGCASDNFYWITVNARWIEIFCFCYDEWFLLKKNSLKLCHLSSIVCNKINSIVIFGGKYSKILYSKRQIFIQINGFDHGESLFKFLVTPPRCY